MAYNYEKEYEKIANRLLELSLSLKDIDGPNRPLKRHISAEHIPVFLEDWILHVYIGKGLFSPDRHSYLAPDCPFRVELDAYLGEKGPDYIRGLYLYLQQEKGLGLRNEPWDGWQNAFKSTFLDFVRQKNISSVTCPYQCAIFDKVIPDRQYYYLFSRGPIEGRTNMLILRGPVVPIELLDSLYKQNDKIEIFSFEKITADEDIWKHAINRILSKYDISIYQSGLWVMLSYHPRKDNENPSVHLFDLDNKKDWLIPAYALASVLPSSYIRFATKPFFIDVQKRPASEFDIVVTSKALSACRNKTNSLINIQKGIFDINQPLDAYCEVSGPAIVIESNTALILGSTGPKTAIPKSALAIIPDYLHGHHDRDCMDNLHKHAQRLLDDWGQLFDSLEIKMDNQQKFFWAHYCPQNPIQQEEKKKMALDELVVYLQMEYETTKTQEEMKKTISRKCSSASDLTSKVRAAYVLCQENGWHKGNRYPTLQWAAYFGENPRSFRNRFTLVKKEEDSKPDESIKTIPQKQQDNDLWSCIEKM